MLSMHGNINSMATNWEHERNNNEKKKKRIKTWAKPKQDSF